MEYTLSSEATRQTLPLNAQEWEMLRKLAAQPAGWKPNEERDYTQGSISAEETLEMAESVRLSLPSLGKAFSTTQALEAETLEELQESLGYVEGDPFTYFGDDARRRKVEAFVRLASAGGLEVLLRRRE